MIGSSSRDGGCAGFQVRVDHVRGVPVAALRGDLDMATVPVVDEVVAPLLAPGARGLILDLAGLDFCGSTGLAWLVRAHHLAVALGFPLVLCGCRAPLRRLMDLTGLLSLFTHRAYTLDGVEAVLAST